MKKIVGHKPKIDFLDRVIKQKAIKHAYLFYGPEKVGKTTTALLFAQTLLCSKKDLSIEPCEECHDCRLFDSDNHPDLFLNDSVSTVSVDEIRTLINFLDLKPYQSRRKVVVITHAERMTSQAANAFLKSLEEPPPNSVIIMTTENPDKLLPTIVSRTQAIQFGSIKQQEIMEHLVDERGIDQEKALKISRFSAGKIGQAISISSEMDSFRNDQDFLKEFDLMVSEGSIYEKIRYAEKNGAEREATEKRFDAIELYYQQRIIGLEKINQGLKTTQILDKIAQSREFLNKNVNPRLVWENILLARGSDD